MIAIWPAGPPKLMKPSLSQKRNASAKLTTPVRSFSGGSTASSVGVCGAASGIAGLVVYGCPRTVRKECVQELPSRVESGGVRTFLGDHLFGDHHAPTVDHIEQAWRPDGDIQE